MIIHEGGGGGEDYCDGSVTEGVQNSLNLCDVIYERPPMQSIGYWLRARSVEVNKTDKVLEEKVYMRLRLIP